MKYLVNLAMATRKNPNPEHKDWDVFIDYEEGKIVDKFPEHVTVQDWIDSGHLSAIDEKPSKKEDDVSGEIEEK